MIVTKGTVVRIEAGEFIFERSAETPGLVTVKRGHVLTMHLFANPQEVESFIKAYRAIAGEDIAYRTQEVK